MLKSGKGKFTVNTTCNTINLIFKYFQTRKTAIMNTSVPTIGDTEVDDKIREWLEWDKVFY